MAGLIVCKRVGPEDRRGASDVVVIERRAFSRLNEDARPSAHSVLGSGSDFALPVREVVPVDIGVAVDIGGVGQMAASHERRATETSHFS